MLFTHLLTKPHPKFVLTQGKYENRKGFIEYKYFDQIRHNPIIKNIPYDDDNTIRYCEITDISKFGDITPYSINPDNIEAGSEEHRILKKIEKGDIIRAKEGNILISSVRPYLKKFVYINREKEQILFTKALIMLNPKVNNKFFYYLLRIDEFANQITSISRTGKSYPTVERRDILRFLQAPVSLFQKRHEFLNKQIAKYENKISQKSEKKKPLQEIINQVFAEEFGFNIKSLQKQSDRTAYKKDLTNVEKSFELRNSYKFHNPAYDEIERVLRKIGYRRLKTILAADIRLGTGISTNDYDDENGEAYYISMATIKNRIFDSEAARKVSMDFWEAKKKHFYVQKDDIIMARSGEGTIGKAAILAEDYNAVFCDFTMRIRVQGYNPYFAYYYFNSDLFQGLVEREKKGLGNNTNIFPSQIKEFPIPDIDLKRQNRIVEKIKKEIDGQELINLEIEEKRKEIEKLILRTIRK
ncbi:MAG: hypothetical protein M0Z70_00390 [Nitrospiraceae bacterium]|nr:hypothetical protein [Nitrospiraceae bacterium]